MVIFITFYLIGNESYQQKVKQTQQRSDCACLKPDIEKSLSVNCFELATKTHFQSPESSPVTYSVLFKIYNIVQSQEVTIYM